MRRGLHQPYLDRMTVRSSKLGVTRVDNVPCKIDATTVSRNTAHPTRRAGYLRKQGSSDGKDTPSDSSS